MFALTCILELEVKADGLQRLNTPAQVTGHLDDERREKKQHPCQITSVDKAGSAHGREVLDVPASGQSSNASRSIGLRGRIQEGEAGHA